MAMPKAPAQPRSRKPGKSSSGGGLTYAAAGVNLEAKDRFTDSLESIMRRTHGPRVISNPGGFAGLFLAYALYRWQYQPAFYEVHKKLNVWMGGTNTVVLLFSSFTMALGVHFAMLKKRKEQLICLSITLLCAFTFLVIKFFEYKEKIDHHLVPGSNFQWHDSWVPANVAQLFFVLYFFMTGLHGIHVLVGILVIATLMFMTWRKYPQVEDYINVAGGTKHQVAIGQIAQDNFDVLPVGRIIEPAP